MIHIDTERLLPISELPTCPESRGFGRRIAKHTVYGRDGARREAIRIGGRVMTSIETVERWAGGSEPSSGRRTKIDAFADGSGVAASRRAVHRGPA